MNNKEYKNFSCQPFVHEHYTEEKIDEFKETHCIGNRVSLIKSTLNSTEGEGVIIAVAFTPLFTGSSDYKIKLDDRNVVEVTGFCFRR